MTRGVRSVVALKNTADGPAPVGAIFSAAAAAAGARRPARGLIPIAPRSPSPASPEFKSGPRRPGAGEARPREGRAEHATAGVGAKRLGADGAADRPTRALIPPPADCPPLLLKPLLLRVSSTTPLLLLSYRSSFTPSSWNRQSTSSSSNPPSSSSSSSRPRPSSSS